MAVRRTELLFRACISLFANTGLLFMIKSKGAFGNAALSFSSEKGWRVFLSPFGGGWMWTGPCAPPHPALRATYLRPKSRAARGWPPKCACGRDPPPGEGVAVQIRLCLIWRTAPLQGTSAHGPQACARQRPTAGNLVFPCFRGKTTSLYACFVPVAL